MRPHSEAPCSGRGDRTPLHHRRPSRKHCIADRPKNPMGVRERRNRRRPRSLGASGPGGAQAVGFDLSPQPRMNTNKHASRTDFVVSMQSRGRYSTMTRREMLGTLAGATPLLGAVTSLFGADAPRRKRLGVCTYSCNIHWKAARDGHPKARFKDTIEFLEYCHQLGAGGVQIGVCSRNSDYPKKLRAKAESYEMYFEGQAGLPQQSSDVDRFDGEIHAAREAGAAVVRTAMLGGRRYETFDSAEAFRQFAEKSWQSLTLAEPVLKKHRVRLAIENHKDRRLPEMLEMLKRISSEY